MTSSTAEATIVPITLTVASFSLVT